MKFHPNGTVRRGGQNSRIIRRRRTEFRRVVSLCSIFLIKPAEFLPSTFDIRPARNALKPIRGKFSNLIHNALIMLTQHTLHGRRVFAFLKSFFFDQTGRCFAGG
jgi:hypothetical protein